MLNRFCRQFLLNKELGITLLSYVSIFFSGIITIKVFTYLLSPKDYGQLGLISSLSSLFITTLVSPFMQSASRYFVHSNPILSFKYVNRYIKKIELIFIVCILILAIYLFLQREVLSSISLSLLLITLIIDTRGQFYTSFLHLNRKRLEYTISTSIFNWLKLIIAIPLLFFIKFFPGVYLVLIAWILSSFLSNLYSKNHVYISSSNNENFEKENWNSLDILSIKKFTLNFIILNIFLWLQGWADKWILSYTLDESNELGEYISYNQIAMIPYTAINGLIIMYFGPIIYSKISQSTKIDDFIFIKKQIIKLKTGYILLSLFIFFCMITVNNYILQLLLNNNYKIDSKLFLLSSLASLMFNFTQIQSFSVQCTGNLKKIIIPNVIVGILLVFGNIIITPKYGLYGAVLVLNIIMSIKILLMYFFEKYSWREYLNSFSK